MVHASFYKISVLLCKKSPPPFVQFPMEDVLVVKTLLGLDYLHGLWVCLERDYNASVHYLVIYMQQTSRFL